MQPPSEDGLYSQLYSFLSEHIQHSQRELEGIFSSDSGYQISGICKYIIDAGGKRLRPLLTLLACESVEGDYRKALPVCVATELAHTLSIIQDDIFDQATIRRGVKPIHVAWGTPMAILASDYLFLKMFESLLKLANSDLNPQKLSQILGIVVAAGLESVEGEYLDLRLSEKDEATIEECISIAKKKTSSLIKAAVESGAIIGGGSEEEIEALKNYSEKLGISYQITDDLLGLIGTQNLAGKDIGSDIKNKRVTVVIAHALQNSSLQDRKRIAEILKNQDIPSDYQVKNLRGILEETGSIRFAQEMAEEYAEKAVADLHLLKPTKAKDILGLIPPFIVYRKW